MQSGTKPKKRDRRPTLSKLQHVGMSLFNEQTYEAVELPASSHNRLLSVDHSPQTWLSSNST